MTNATTDNRLDPATLPPWALVTAVLFFLAMAIQFTFPVGDGDFYWHVRTGQWIWEHRSIPTADPFSFTVRDVNPFTGSSQRLQFLLGQYWLGQLAFYAIWQVGGEAGMVLARTGIYLAILAGIFWWTRRHRQGIVPLATLFLVGSVLRGYPNERPQIFAYLLMPLLLFLLEQLRTGSRLRPLPAAALVGVMLLWSNCHGSFILGVVVLTLYGAGHLIDRLSRREAVSLPFLALLAGAGLATLANPNGYRAFTAFFSLSSTYTSLIAEYISPITLAYRFHAFDYAYWCLVLMGTVVYLRSCRRMAAAHRLVIPALLLLSLTGVRYIPFFALAAPLLALYAPDWRPAGRLALLPPALMLLWAATADYRNALKFRAERSYPVQATRFLNGARPAGNMFNFIGWGGYLLCYTGYPVFVDGRALAEEFVYLHDNVLNGVDWRRTLATYRINVIVIPGTHPISGKAYPLLLQMLGDEEWALVYQDDVALVFLRNAEENRQLLARYALSKDRITEHITSRWQWQLQNRM